MYIFTKDKGVGELIINQTRSGAVCVNDTVMQYAGELGFQNGEGLSNESCLKKSV